MLYHWNVAAYLGFENEKFQREYEFFFYEMHFKLSQLLSISTVFRFIVWNSRNVSLFLMQ